MTTITSRIFSWLFPSVVALMILGLITLAPNAYGQDLSAQVSSDSASSSAQAPQGNAPLTLTLQDALERAKKNNSEYRAAQTEFGVAKEDRVQSRAALLPNVGF